MLFVWVGGGEDVGPGQCSRAPGTVTYTVLVRNAGNVTLDQTSPLPKTSWPELSDLSCDPAEPAVLVP